MALEFLAPSPPLAGRLGFLLGMAAQPKTGPGLPPMRKLSYSFAEKMAGVRSASGTALCEGLDKNP
jgi:hypothetical protein